MASNIPAVIIDYYFPETKGIDTSDSRVYFDMSAVLEPMENRSALEVEVGPAPKGTIYAKKFIVSGDVQREEYHIWLRQQALNLGVHGHIKNFGFDEIEIVAASTSRKRLRKFRSLLNEFKNGKNITKIKTDNYEEQILKG